MLYGIHPVKEAIRAGRRVIYEVFLLEKERSVRLSAIETLAESRSVPVRHENAKTLTRRCGSETHQGAVVRTGPYPYLSGADLLHRAGAPESDAPFFVLLDSIQDPHNFGAIVRTALCAGVDGLVVAKNRSAPAGPSVSKVSAGALEHAKVYRVTNLADTLVRLRKQTRLWVVGLEKNARRSIYDLDLSGPLGLVIGGEGKGIRQLVRKRCDELVSIPQTGPVDSLNASVASALGIYEAMRQRSANVMG